MNEIKIVLNVPKWNVEELTGYKPITTFWQDFSIADRFGIDAIKDTFSVSVSALPYFSLA